MIGKMSRFMCFAFGTAKDIVDHLYQFEAFIDSGRNAVSGARAVMFSRIWKAMNNNLFRTKAVPVELCFAAVKR